MDSLENWHPYHCKGCPEKFKATIDFSWHLRLNPQHRRPLVPEVVSVKPQPGGGGDHGGEKMESTLASFSNEKNVNPVIDEDEDEETMSSTEDDYQFTTELSEKQDEFEYEVKNCVYAVADVLQPLILKVKKRPVATNNAPSVSTLPFDQQDCSVRGQSPRMTTVAATATTAEAPLVPVPSVLNNTMAEDREDNQKYPEETEMLTSWDLETQPITRFLKASSPCGNSNSSVSLSSSTSAFVVGDIQSPCMKYASTETPRIPSRLPTLSWSFDNGRVKYAHGKESDDDDSPRTWWIEVKVWVLENSNPLPVKKLGVLKKSDFKGKCFFPCRNCDYVAKTYREIQAHVNTHLAKSFPCEFCLRVYRNKQVILKHLEKHADLLMKDKSAAKRKNKQKLTRTRRLSNSSSSSDSFSTSSTNGRNSSTDDVDKDSDEEVIAISDEDALATFGQADHPLDSTNQSLPNSFEYGMNGDYGTDVVAVASAEPENLCVEESLQEKAGIELGDENSYEDVEEMEFTYEELKMCGYQSP